jgi:holo-[acyl-carrier protein] synthase
MIYSTGIDLVDVGRIRDGYKRFGDKYLTRLFSDDEIADMKSRRAGMIETMAGKFAAKEAVMKSLGVFFEDGVTVKDIEILRRPDGMPHVRLPEHLRRRLPGRSIMISISHEKHYAAAVAIITDEG